MSFGKTWQKNAFTSSYYLLGDVESFSAPPHDVNTTLITPAWWRGRLSHHHMLQNTSPDAWMKFTDLVIKQNNKAERFHLSGQSCNNGRTINETI